jgi:hypothetical protein
LQAPQRKDEGDGHNDYQRNYRPVHKCSLP